MNFFSFLHLFIDNLVIGEAWTENGLVVGKGLMLYVGPNENLANVAHSPNTWALMKSRHAPSDHNVDAFL